MIEKWDAFPLLYLKDVLILLRQFHIVIVYAPRSSGDRAPPSGGGSGGSNPPGCVLFLLFLMEIYRNYRKYRRYEVKKIIDYIAEELSEAFEKQVMTERMEK